jgi:hypothetical protein
LGFVSIVLGLAGFATTVYAAISRILKKIWKRREEADRRKRLEALRRAHLERFGRKRLNKGRRRVRARRTNSPTIARKPAKKEKPQTPPARTPDEES